MLRLFFVILCGLLFFWGGVCLAPTSDLSSQESPTSFDCESDPEDLNTSSYGATGAFLKRPKHSPTRPPSPERLTLRRGFIDGVFRPPIS